LKQSKFTHEIGGLGEIPIGDHLRLPGEMAQAGLQLFEAAAMCP